MTAGFDRRALVKLRAARGLLQDDVARALGVSRQAVSQWERGIASPLADMLPLLAAILDCRIDDLFILVTTGNPT
jgi:transcriptional regulator with XRE-family HTH domain